MEQYAVLSTNRQSNKTMPRQNNSSRIPQIAMRSLANLDL
jgi:hypothetical protein